MGSNERLRAAIAEAGLTSDLLGEDLKVDPKTIDRWVGLGRVPHRRSRQATALRLGKDEHYLWPDALSQSRIEAASTAEVVAVHPNRGSVPAGTWESLLHRATDCIDVLAFAATFLHDTIADFDEIVAARSRAGTRVRLLFGDPESQAVELRGREEGLGEGLRARCRLTWLYMKPLLDLPGVEARAHGATLYSSIFRFDDQLFANHHAFGAPANHSPVMHLHRIAGGRMFDHQMKSFERVWDDAQPISAASFA